MQPQVFRKRTIPVYITRAAASTAQPEKGWAPRMESGAFRRRGDPKEEAWAGVSGLGSFPSCPRAYSRRTGRGLHPCRAERRPRPQARLGEKAHVPIEGGRTLHPSEFLRVPLRWSSWLEACASWNPCFDTGLSREGLDSPRHRERL